jgi:hypothetical protein
MRGVRDRALADPHSSICKAEEDYGCNGNNAGSKRY